MRVMPLQNRGITDSRLVLGCMGLGGNWDETSPITADDRKKAQEAIEAALSIGITMFDHADIYCRGKSETLFGEILASNPSLREKLVLQSKCGILLGDGILPERFNFSKEHILKSVDGILQRLGIPYLDILLLHRPDPLVEPDQVAEALDSLEQAGKVRSFGVSNMDMAQIKYLRSAVSQPLIVNQLELGLGHLDFINRTVFVNQDRGADVNFGDGIMEYCQLEDIQLQAWGPLAQGRFSGRGRENESESVQAAAKLVQQLANEKETTAEAVVLGWLMKHPAKIQPIIGTLNPERIMACQDAPKIAEQLTRDEWYTLYMTARGWKKQG